MMLREKMIPCQSREAVVTVVSYHRGIMDGCLRHPRLREGEKIESLSQLILLLNSLPCQNYIAVIVVLIFCNRILLLTAERPTIKSQ